MCHLRVATRGSHVSPPDRAGFASGGLYRALQISFEPGCCVLLYLGSQIYLVFDAVVFILHDALCRLLIPGCFKQSCVGWHHRFILTRVSAAVFKLPQTLLNSVISGSDMGDQWIQTCRVSLCFPRIRGCRHRHKTSCGTRWSSRRYFRGNCRRDGVRQGLQTAARRCSTFSGKVQTNSNGQQRRCAIPAKATASWLCTTRFSARL